ncbi:hypothetical protein E0H26_14595 [Micromonospora zingiberis]|uniref:Uncharacterized protein n=1 Tax=Micromonospora zingiberis TaxID=2053011 RepID=A0A4R0GK69_9ACTN|nr:hypothetical protein E0H26_14595 [Micromonospora zingiberis]
MHAAATLGFARRAGREHWWQQLGEPVRDRMIARVGPMVDWWADCHQVDGDRAYAVVLGPRGLAVCTPTVNDRGGRAQLLTVVPFVPASLRHAVVVQKPARRLPGRPSLPAGQSTAPVAPDLPLSAGLRDLLGNLPADAQARLQWPFVNGDVLTDSGYYYRGDDDRLEIWAYLAGRRWVTFVSGHGSGRSGPAHRVSWQLICRQAEVAG